MAEVVEEKSGIILTKINMSTRHRFFIRENRIYRQNKQQKEVNPNKMEWTTSMARSFNQDALVVDKMKVEFNQDLQRVYILDESGIKHHIDCFPVFYRDEIMASKILINSNQYLKKDSLVQIVQITNERAIEKVKSKPCKDIAVVVRIDD